MRTTAVAPIPVANTCRHGHVPRPGALLWCALAVCVACITTALAQPAPATTTPAAAQRPKIGLVLSGGGARGLTHIGVLKVLEEARIPVDYVSATSMGSIVGGLYAMGMRPADMEHIVTTVTWSTLFSDSPPRRELTVREKEIDRRFPLPLEVGIRGTQILGFKGVLTGANLTLFLHELSIAADGVKELDQLPIPFRCVATDMVTGRPYVFTTGPLYVAMRSSMSIPGLFSPTEVEGQILGDGGLVDNLPVNVVREMGADIVIAVNIGTPLATRDQLSSIVGLTGQMINILTEQNVRRQLASLGPRDVLIAPDLGTLNAIDFTRGADFIRLGEEAARAALPQLAALALPEAQYAAYKAALPPLLAPAPAVIEFVRVEGTHYANPAALEARLAIPLGKPLDVKEVNDRVSRLYGSNDFESIAYHVVEEGDKSGLVFGVTEKSTGPNYLRFGLAFNSDFQGESVFSLLAGFKKVWIDSLGAQLLAELEVGRIFRAAGHFYQPLDYRQTFFVSAQGSLQNAPRYVFSGSNRVAEYAIQTNSAGVDFGMAIGDSGQIRFGPIYTYYKGTPTIALPDFPIVRQTDAGGHLAARWDNLDHAFFPRRGLHADFDVFYGDRTQRIGSDADEVSKNLARGEFFGNAGFAFGANDFINVAARAGGLSRDDPSVVNPFLLGGFLNLSGLRIQQLAGSYVGFGRVVYYHRLTTIPWLGGDVFAGGSLEAGNTWQQRSAISGGDLFKAGSAFLAADTFVGPLYFGYGRASGGASSFYLLLGRPP
jgi:NTE family protein